MDAAEVSVARLTADLFRAVAHPARVRVLEVLMSGESSVGVLAERLGMEISHLSHQLGVLRRAHLVVTRREGPMVYYSIRDPRLSQLLAVAKQMLVSSLEDSRDLLVTMGEADLQDVGARVDIGSSQ
ncbi:ArsR/SmtB family transcription factor [Lacisediminihabitans profunda]|uniref:Winged helix-turn-helix transcriptional regulator n=1 Tax=Lacisediminihabitans profunda TaxID=2594790 RepID=A0A5C8UKX3_9MICO|nr:metalloregulator ArsR/SmtB family transcription factor [Lacisediminihabitans profunda]TXN28925.1 winged helix-turn-helix transcriptional regulator [Lacisediminihabitans profunda]